MVTNLNPRLRINIVLTILTGMLYPLAVTGVCQALFPHQANGSLIRQGGKVVGSELIGQNFTKPEYFHPRPSAAGNDGYDATASGGIQLRPHQSEADRPGQRPRRTIPQRQSGLPRADSGRLLTASGSGSRSRYQPGFGSRAGPTCRQGARHLRGSIGPVGSPATQQPDLGVLGEPRVNVLKLNLALDRQFPRKQARLIQ